MIPELEALVPKYLGQQFAEAAPGHRFMQYFNYWDAGKFTPYKDARLPDIKHLEKNERDRIRKEFEKRKNRAINDACPLPKSAINQTAALRTRQQSLIQHYGSNGYRISTTSTAPFATGLGNEHPIENGFAFLTPYGLPYLAGSGVKGILRRSMQDLMKEREEGFTSDVIDVLFGPEEVNQPEDAKRGAFDFWDVFPSPAEGKLVVEIMTPHYGKYYQGEEPPHDSGAPVPVSFLAVPAKSQFDFHVVCHTSRLPELLTGQWSALLDRAFQHAFEWVGFGAKTSVGYGAMAPVAARAPATHTPEPGGASSSGASSSAGSAAVQTWPTATLTLNTSTGEVKASFGGKTTAGIKGLEAEKIRTALGEERANKFKKNKELKGIPVVVLQNGNMLVLKGLSTP